MLCELAMPPASRSPFLARGRPDSDDVFLQDLRASTYYAASPPADAFIVHDRPDSDDGFMEDLREFICLRLDRVDPYESGPKEYRIQREKAAGLYAQLREMLPEEGRALLLQYSESLGAAQYLETAMLAEKAFLDGMRLLVRVMMNAE